MLCMYLADDGNDEIIGCNKTGSSLVQLFSLRSWVQLPPGPIFIPQVNYGTILSLIYEFAEQSHYDKLRYGSMPILGYTAMMSKK
jgi:hypothetical protein